MPTESEKAGMVRIYSLRPGAEFTFAPRRGRYRVVGRVPKGNRLIYEAIDPEGRAELDGQQHVAMTNWWVWDLTEEGSA